jgi:hypothetical protein
LRTADDRSVATVDEPLRLAQVLNSEFAGPREPASPLSVLRCCFSLFSCSGADGGCAAVSASANWGRIDTCANSLEAGAKTIVSHGPDRVKAFTPEFSATRLSFPLLSPKTPDAGNPSVMVVGHRLHARLVSTCRRHHTHDRDGPPVHLERTLKPWRTQEIAAMRRTIVRRSRRQAREGACVRGLGSRDRPRHSQPRQFSSARVSWPASSSPICCG